MEHLTEREREMLARCEKATPGPWASMGKVTCGKGCINHCWHTFDVQADILPPMGESGPVAIAAQKEFDNAAFIAHARTDIPELLQAVADLRQQVAQLTEERDVKEQSAIAAAECGKGWAAKFRAAEAKLAELAPPERDAAIEEKAE